MNTKEITTEIEKIIKPIIKSYQMELVDVEWTHKNGSWNLCIYIDKPAGITIDDCELVNREISDLLDRIDLIHQSFVLEVSSPGLNRPLKKREDFERFINNTVKITTVQPLQGQKKFKGVLVDITVDGQLLLKTDKGEETVISLDKVAKANLWFQPDFNKDSKGGIKKK